MPRKIIWIADTDKNSIRNSQRVVNNSGSMKALCLPSLQAIENIVSQEAEHGKEDSGRRPSLILTDFDMMREAGFAPLKRFREINILAGVPVCMISPNPEAAFEDSYKNGALFVLKKPLAEMDITRIENAAWQYENTRSYEMIVQKQLVELRTAREISRLNEQLRNRNELLHQLFGRYFQEEVVNVILDHPEEVSLGGEKKQIAVMMADIRGFTSKSEEIGAEAITDMLNCFLGKMTSAISLYHGTVIEFLGDGILAVFGAPLSHEDDDRRKGSKSRENHGNGGNSKNIEKNDRNDGNNTEIKGDGYSKNIEKNDRNDGNNSEIKGDGDNSIQIKEKVGNSNEGNAIAAAILMQNSMKDLNEWCKSKDYPQLEMGIGLHSGEAFVGNVGTENMMRFNVIGKVVNECSRIEGYSVGGQVLASKETIERAGCTVTVEKELSVKAKGVPVPMTVCILSGIDGKYRLHLASEEPEEFFPVKDEILFSLSILEGKQVSSRQIPALLFELSKKSAWIRKASSLPNRYDEPVCSEDASLRQNSEEPATAPTYEPCRPSSSLLCQNSKGSTTAQTDEPYCPSSSLLRQNSERPTPAPTNEGPDPYEELPDVFTNVTLKAYQRDGTELFSEVYAKIIERNQDTALLRFTHTNEGFDEFLSCFGNNVGL